MAKSVSTLTSRNFSHPERQPHEVWISNMARVDYDVTWHRSSRKSLRSGNRAYDENGQPAAGMVPVFVSLDELSTDMDVRVNTAA